MTTSSAMHAANGVLVLRGVLDDAIGQALRALLAASEPEDLRRAYDEFWLLLADEAEMLRHELAGNAWQNHLLDRLVSDENIFSRKLQHASIDEIGPAVRQAVTEDLERLQILYNLDIAHLAQLAGRRADWDGFQPRRLAPLHPFKKYLACLSNWREALPELAALYASHGTGIWASAVAFRWQHNGTFLPVPYPDPIHLDELIGYDTERKLLLQNTEHFVAGLPANHVLLTGDPGTGKSSTVKALLHEYSDRGLRMVEVGRHELTDLPSITALLRERPERFILFVDDLSFEEHETAYKDLKALLEGSLEARPSNILVYATSNRRHLIRELHSDREPPGSSEDIHPLESMHEKLSFSDRFGISIRFHAPDQKRFLQIVDGLAAQRNLAVDPETLHQRALQWSMRQNGFSGRTARQFIDHLTAELQSN